MGWLDKLLGRTKGATQRGSTAGEREGARPSEPARTPGESTRPTEPAGAERREGVGPERGPTERM